MKKLVNKRYSKLFCFLQYLQLKKLLFLCLFTYFKSHFAKRQITYV